MKFTTKIVSLLSAVIFGLAACSTNNADKTERTFPQAFNFRKVSLQQLQDELTPPDSVNIGVYVVEKISSYGIVPRGIFLSESPDSSAAKASLFLEVMQPDQFITGERYNISVAKEVNSSGTRTSFRLLGYSSAQKD